ncbi:hypothetical protein ISN44_As08g025880 [Arabidopsis suecica]|uniref:Uncharacterized protein n=1 Tax=Arabidopsis suecica TaxID=45249 RepID=A0A8T2BAE5_ARASU|nr:hypothetical protein ISN44_As08g025880 [Arabidopsis suecica]
MIMAVELVTGAWRLTKRQHLSYLMVEKVLGSPFSFAGHGVESRLGSSFWVVLFAERTLVAFASSLDGSFLSFHS